MKIKFRRTVHEDLLQVYELHCKCFTENDQWYKSAIRNYLDNGIVIEKEGSLIGVLLQGGITPCNQNLSLEENPFSGGYKADIFEPVNETGKIIIETNLHYTEMKGIVMICVDPKYRGKGLAKKLIEKHFQDNKNQIVCLNTRRSNIGAFMLYKSMGYEHVALIKNKYFQPTEDSIFMIKKL
jgi:ribosomal protein S18 acetylase RimI-like enzyme